MNRMMKILSFLENLSSRRSNQISSRMSNTVNSAYKTHFPVDSLHLQQNFHVPQISWQTEPTELTEPAEPAGRTDRTGKIARIKRIRSLPFQLSGIN
jgi:hypothetical protein